MFYYLQWFSKDDWKVIYHQNYILPALFRGMKLCTFVFGQWKEALEDSKNFKEQKKAALESYRANIINSTILQLVQVEQLKAWKAQAESRIPESQLRLALKYGRRWRMKVQTKLTGRAKIIELRQPFLEDEQSFNFKLRSRPAPRKPDFLFAPANNDFGKKVGTFNVECAKPQILTDAGQFLLPLLPDSESPCSPPNDHHSNSISCIEELPISIQSFASSNLPCPPSKIQTIDSLQADLLAEKSRYKLYIENKKLLSQVENELEEFSTSICDVDIVDCLKRRKQLLISTQKYENSRLETKQSILKAKEQLQHFRHQLSQSH